MADKVYRATLPNTFEAPRRNRAGVTIESGPNGSLLKGLSKEQLAAIKDDSMITLKEVKASDLKGLESSVSDYSLHSEPDAGANPVTDRGAPLGDVGPRYSHSKQAAVKAQAEASDKLTGDESPEEAAKIQQKAHEDAIGEADKAADSGEPMDLDAPDAGEEPAREGNSSTTPAGRTKGPQ